MGQLSVSMKEVTELLGKLIRIDSQNTPRCTTEIAEFIANYFEKDGLHIDLVSSVKKKPSQNMNTAKPFSLNADSTAPTTSSMNKNCLTFLPPSKRESMESFKFG